MRWALLLVVAGASVLRFTDLASNPGGLFPDEAAEGLDALRLLHLPGYHPVFFHDDGGREALFGYLVAAVFRAAGESVLSLRGTAAAIGVLAVPAIWLAARRFGSWPALAAAAWAAGSLWLIAISRNGMRNTLVPALGALALVGLLAWHDRPGRRTAAIAGAVTALAALYTYQPLKLLPIVVVAWLLWIRHVDRARFAALRPGFGAFAVAFVVVGLPMAAAAIADPLTWFGRAASVSPFNPDVQSDSGPIEHIVRTLGMFTLVGDPMARHDVDGLPLLGLPLSVVALIGLIRLWGARAQPAAALIIWSLGIFLVPPLIAVEGASPHFLRALGLAAPLGVTIGLGFDDLARLAALRWRRHGARLTIASSMAGLVILGAASGVAYLGRPVADRYAAYAYDLVAMADLARSAPRTAVVVDDYGGMVIRFLDFGNEPSIVVPRDAVEDRAGVTLVIARSRDDLAVALDPASAERAVPVATDPAGRPTVWAVQP